MPGMLYSLLCSVLYGMLYSMLKGMPFGAPGSLGAPFRELPAKRTLAYPSSRCLDLALPAIALPGPVLPPGHRGSRDPGILGYPDPLYTVRLEMIFFQSIKTAENRSGKPFPQIFPFKIVFKHQKCLTGIKLQK